VVKKIATAVSTVTLAAGAFAFASAGPAMASTGQTQAVQSHAAESGQISPLASPTKCKGNVCLQLKTSSFTKNKKKYVKVKSVTVQLLGGSEGTVLTMQYYGGGHKMIHKPAKCQYSLCAAQWPKLNYNYLEKKTVCGKVIMSGVNEGIACIKL
jgi:hypothetical protein